MASSRAHSETGSVVNTKFGARPIIDLPAFGIVNNRAVVNSNFADIPPKIYGPTAYSYNVGKHVPRDNAHAGYAGQYYNIPGQVSPRSTSNVIQDSNVVPYPSYNTVPNIGAQQQYTNPPPNMGAQQQYANPPPNMGVQQQYPNQPPPPVNDAQYNSNQNTGSGNDVHIYYGPNGERLPGPPTAFRKELMRPVLTRQKSIPTNFEIQGSLEYGKMVSIKIISGNVSFRDIPNFVLENCHKTYRIVPKTEVTVVAKNGEYNVFATPKYQSYSMPQHAGYSNDPKTFYTQGRGPAGRPRTLSPSRYFPEQDIYTKRYDEDYFGHSYTARRHTTNNNYPAYLTPQPDHRRHHTVQNDVQDRRSRGGRHWYSSGALSDIKQREQNDPKNVREPARKPLPMREMRSRRSHQRTS